MRPLNFRFIIFLILTVFVAAGIARAQKPKSIFYDSITSKSDVRIGIRYTSDYFYMGRADSAAAPYLSPSIAYYHKSGFFVRGSLSYLTAPEEGRIDLYTLSGGYDYYGKKFVAGIYISEYFFNDLSYNVQAEMSTYMNAYAGYDFSAFMAFLDASVAFSGSTDLFLGAEINRTFYAFRNKLRITPAVYMNGGSQQYYNEYYSMRSGQTGSVRGKGPGGNGQQPSSTQNAQVFESEKFKILDYEADLQVSYKIRIVRLFVSATWTFPVNPADIVTDQGIYEEVLENGFYWTTGVRFTF